MKNQTTETPRVEEGKVIAERLNGYAAFVGCWALIGASVSYTHLTLPTIYSV